MNNMSVNPKCSICRTYFIPSLKSPGLPYKTCDKCRERSKENNKTEQRKNYMKEYETLNVEKKKERNKEYYKQNTEKIKERNKDYQKINAEKIQERNKEYYKSNADKLKEYRILNAAKIQEYNKEYIKEYRKKMKTNLPWYLIQLQRQQIYRCFKSSSLNKSKHSVEYLGCDTNTLINYFNKKMEYYNSTVGNDVKMTWETIHIDHIKPVSRFNLDDEDEFLDCCHYTNLQPLLEKDNLKKNNKWTKEDNQYWLEHIRNNDDYCEIYLTVV